MILTIVSTVINILLIVAFILDRIFRLRSIKEYKEAKQAQIENLSQQLAIEKANNDVVITEWHKKRVENIKIILDEKETEIEQNKNALLELQSILKSTNKELHLKAELSEILLQEIERIKLNNIALEKNKIALENERSSLLIKIPDFPENVTFRKSNRIEPEDNERHER